MGAKKQISPLQLLLNDSHIVLCSIEWLKDLFDVMSVVERQSFCCSVSIYCLSCSPKADLTGSLSSDCCCSMLGEQGPCVGETSVVYTGMVRPLQSLVGNWETETGAVSNNPNLWNGFYQFQLIQTQMNPDQFKANQSHLFSCMGKG